MTKSHLFAIAVGIIGGILLGLISVRNGANEGRQED